MKGIKVPMPQGSEAKSYYKYYAQEIADVPAEKQEFLKNPWGKKEDGLNIHERNKLFDKGYLTDEKGLFETEDGGIIVANNTFFEGSTGAMLQWWFGWHGIDPLRYACWDCYDHYGLDISFEDMAKIKDPNTSIPEKCYDVTHVVTESLVIGEAPTILYIHFRNPKAMGYQAERIFTDECSFLVTANVEIKTPAGLLPVVMTHIARDVEGGCELRSRFWMGYNIINGKAEYLMPGGVAFPKAPAEQLLGHNFQEFTNLAKILPSIYEEEKDNWD